MKMFISQPMHGRTDEDILKERQEITSAFQNKYGVTVEVIDTFTKSHEDQIKGRIWMLGGSIQLMYDADVVVFAPGFRKAKGCLIEEKVAKLYGIKRQYYLQSVKSFIYGCPVVE